jgi:TH1 protein
VRNMHTWLQSTCGRLDHAAATRCPMTSAADMVHLRGVQAYEQTLRSLVACRLLSQHIARAVCTKDMANQQSAIADLQQIASQGQHTYVFAQTLLSLASTNMNGHLYARLQQVRSGL